jgi:hypothetical protein
VLSAPDRADLFKAGVAIDWSIATRKERHLSGLSALRADGVVHLTSWAIIAHGAAGVALLSPDRTTISTAARLILQALHGEELLLARSEDKASAALSTHQHFVSKRHVSLTSFPRLVGLGSAMIRGVTGCAGGTAPSQNGASGNRSRQAAANIHQVFALDKEFNL